MKWKTQRNLRNLSYINAANSYENMRTNNELKYQCNETEWDN
jgi:hypothetical protein